MWLKFQKRPEPYCRNYDSDLSKMNNSHEDKQNPDFSLNDLNTNNLLCREMAQHKIVFYRFKSMPFPIKNTDYSQRFKWKR